MYLIHPTLNSNSLSFDNLNKLIKDIDKKIFNIAEKLYLNMVYGFNQPIDLNLYEDLCDYKEILISRLIGCNCLEDIYILDLSYKVQKLINTIC